MKITIDTANDSKDELRQTIRLLQSIVDKENNYYSGQENTSSTISSDSNDNEFSLGGLPGMNFGNDDDDFSNNKEDEEPEEQEYKTIIIE